MCNPLQEVKNFFSSTVGAVLGWFLDIPSADDIAASARQIKVNKEGNDVPIDIIYGQRITGGVIIHKAVPSTDTGYLYLVIALCEGEVDSIGNIYFDDVIATNSRFNIDGQLIQTNGSFTAPGSETVVIRKYLGSDTQTADSMLTGAGIGWDSTMTLKGTAYLAIRLKLHKKEGVWSGVPQITAIVNGRKIYDPRLDTTVGGSGSHRQNDASTWALSDNPALCLLDYLTNTRFGKGLAYSKIDLDKVMDAADACDASVSKYTGAVGTEAIFKCNAVLSSGATIFDNVKILLSGMRGLMPYTAGTYSIKVEDDEAAVFNFTTDHIIGSMSVQGDTKKDRYNRVIAKFVNPDANWEADQVSYPEPGSSEYTALLAQDNSVELVTEIDLPTITDIYAARDIARIFLLRSRDNIQVSFRSTAEGLNAAAGDVIRIAHPTPGWVGITNDWGSVADAVTESVDWGLVTASADEFDYWGEVAADLLGKPFRVNRIKLNEDGTCDFEASEHQPGFYPWIEGAEAAAYPDTTLPNPFATIDDITGLTITEDTVVGTAGDLVTAFLIEWTESASPYVDQYEVRIKRSTETDYSFYLTSDPSMIVQGIAVGSTYNIAVRGIITSIGKRADWPANTNKVSVGDQTAPSAPSSLAVAKTALGLELTWTNPAEADTARAEIHLRDTNSPTTATTYRIDTIAARPSETGRYFLGTDKIANNTTKYAWIIAQDLSGNRGTYSGVVQCDQVVTVPTSLILTESTTQDSQGNTIPAIAASWTPPAGNNVIQYLVRWKQSTQSNYQTLVTEDASALIENLVSGKTYNVGVFAISAGGAKSTELTGSELINGDTTAPDAPSSITATSGPLSIKLSWTNPSQADLDAVEIHIRTANTTPTDDTYRFDTVKAKPGKVQSFNIASGDFSLDTTYYIFLKSVDQSGNDGSFASSVNGQFSKPTTGQMQVSVQGWRIDAGKFVQSEDISASVNNPNGIAFNDDGTKMFIIENSNGLSEFSLSTAWDVSTASYVDSYTLDAAIGNARGLHFKDDGTKWFCLDLTNKKVHEHTMGTAFDASTSSYVDAYSVSNVTSFTQTSAFAFNSAGTKFFVSAENASLLGSIFEYSLSTAWDVSTASNGSDYVIANMDDLQFSPDGLRAYLMSSETVVERDLDAAFSFADNAASGRSLRVRGYDSQMFAFVFKPDGQKMYCIGWANDTVNEFNTSIVQEID